MRIRCVLGVLGAVAVGLPPRASADVQMLSPYDVANPGLLPNAAA